MEQDLLDKKHSHSKNEDNIDEEAPPPQEHKLLNDNTALHADQDVQTEQYQVLPAHHHSVFSKEDVSGFFKGFFHQYALFNQDSSWAIVNALSLNLSLITHMLSGFSDRSLGAAYGQNLLLTVPTTAISAISLQQDLQRNRMCMHITACILLSRVVDMLVFTGFEFLGKYTYQFMGAKAASHMVNDHLQLSEDTQKTLEANSYDYYIWSALATLFIANVIREFQRKELKTKKANYLAVGQAIQKTAINSALIFGAHKIVAQIHSKRPIAFAPRAHPTLHTNLWQKINGGGVVNSCQNKLHTDIWSNHVGITATSAYALMSLTLETNALLRTVLCSLFTLLPMATAALRITSDCHSFLGAWVGLQQAFEYFLLAFVVSENLIDNSLVNKIYERFAEPRVHLVEGSESLMQNQNQNQLTT